MVLNIYCGCCGIKSSGISGCLWESETCIFGYFHQDNLFGEPKPEYLS